MPEAPGQRSFIVPGAGKILLVSVKNAADWRCQHYPTYNAQNQKKKLKTSYGLDELKTISYVYITPISLVADQKKFDCLVCALS